MRNLLSLVGLAVVLFAGLGWYLGWYQFTTELEPSGHRRIDIDVNTNKISKDVGKGEKEVSDFLSKKTGEVSQAVQTVPTVPANQPVQVQPAGLSGGAKLNPDGTVSYQGNFTLPKIQLPTNPQ